MNNPAVPTIRLKSDRVPGHPWVWSAQIVKPEERLPPGSVVDVLDAKGRFVGRGFWNGHARVALRHQRNQGGTTQVRSQSPQATSQGVGKVR